MRQSRFRYNTSSQISRAIPVRLPSYISLFPERLFSWHPGTTSKDNILSVGKICQGERHRCTLMFSAPPAPADCTLNLITKYTLESDGMTEIRKTLSLDIPVIQPFHTTFDILPQIAKDGMPDLFSEGGHRLSVSQSWLLMSSITKLGSDKLELQHIGVDGIPSLEDLHLDIKEVSCISSSEPLPGNHLSCQNNHSS